MKENLIERNDVTTHEHMNNMLRWSQDDGVNKRLRTGWLIDLAFCALEEAKLIDNRLIGDDVIETMVTDLEYISDDYLIKEYGGGDDGR